MAKKRKIKKSRLGLCIAMVLLFIVLVVGVVYFFQSSGKFWGKIPSFPGINMTQKPKLKVVDEDSDERPIAVMINNHSQAVPNHSGLQEAYLVYEIIAEGGLTRLMAIFKGKDLPRIGSVRSSRHYFLDYALENDAIYTHFGFSDRAKDDIASLGINNVNGLYDSGFIRDTSLKVDYEHTAYISTENIKKVAAYRNYRMTSDKDLLLNYKIVPINMSKIENAQKADTVDISYSYYQKTSYVYDSDAKVYKRFINGKAHTDGVTKEQYTAKNIITYQVSNYSFDSYGRQDLNNIGTGTGYYISNGYAIPIKWEKKSRESQTVYYYENGKELEVNDGNTFIQIQPKNQSLEIKANPEESNNPAQ